ncbi:MAG: MarR family transcriptional regulator [Pseudomonadota bacterium]
MSKQETSTDFTLARSVTHLLHRAQQAAVNESAAGLADQGLTIRQFAVLAALNDDDGQSQSSLVDVTGIDRSTLADMVSRMEKTGLVQRVKSVEDARAKAVSLTSAGRKAFEGAAPEVMEADAILTEELRKSRRESLLLSLSIISGDYEEEEDEPRKSKKKKKKKKKKKR